MAAPTAPSSPAPSGAGANLNRRTLLLGTVAAGLIGTQGATVSASAHPGQPAISSATTTRVGRLEITALLDASGPFPASWEAMFADATGADWAAARSLDPEAFGDDGLWHLDFHCFAVRYPSGRVMLVDSGVGPENSPASGWAPVPGRLPRALSEAGISPDDVDVVVMTHLHEDHVGWAVGPDGTPMFPNARYVVQGDEVDYLAGVPGSAVWSYVVEPLLGTGQLDQIRGWTRLAGSARETSEKIIAVPTPGHTAGHQSVVVDGPLDQVIITGDVLVHAVQLVDPDVAYYFENDAATARSSRKALLRGAERRHAILATAHLNQPFIRVGTR